MRSSSPISFSLPTHSTFDALKSAYAEAARGLIDGGSDVLLAGCRIFALEYARFGAVRAARERENVTFARLARGPANREAIAAFREKRKPDFTRLPPDDS